MRKAIQSGSFDPYTLGHLEVLESFIDMFDEVHIVVAVNTKKKHMFDLIRRVDIIEESIKGKPYESKIVVTAYSGLLVKYMKAQDISYSLRGFRNIVDVNYEMNLDSTNKKLYPNFKTLYYAMPQSDISSSTVRELLKYSALPEGYLAEGAMKYIKSLKDFNEV